jgi:hypothetical protein
LCVDHRISFAICRFKANGSTSALNGETSTLLIWSLSHCLVTSLTGTRLSNCESIYHHILPNACTLLGYYVISKQKNGLLKKKQAVAQHYKPTTCSQALM